MAATSMARPTRVPSIVNWVPGRMQDDEERGIRSCIVDWSLSFSVDLLLVVQVLSLWRRCLAGK